MIRLWKRLALVTACAAALSVPALAREHWRSHRSNVVVVVGGRSPYYRSPYYYDRGYVRWSSWRDCDVPPDLAWRYGCYYDRPVVLVPRYHYYRPYYYRPRSGVSLFFRIR